MAVELTKVALWIETVEPGKPLGFLDANIRCGDSLLGVFDLEALRKGIPDAAYKPLTGDDKATAEVLRRSATRRSSEGQGNAGLLGAGGRLPARHPGRSGARACARCPRTVPSRSRKSARAFDAAHADSLRWTWGIAADTYVAAFLTPKTRGGIRRPDQRL